MSAVVSSLIEKLKGQGVDAAAIIAAVEVVAKQDAERQRILLERRRKMTARAPRQGAAEFSSQQVSRMMAADRQARYRASGWRLPEAEWLKLCRQVFGRDGRCCRYCGDRHGPFAVDHIVPVSKGGGHDLQNLAVACRRCNCSKGALNLEDWRARRGN